MGSMAKLTKPIGSLKVTTPSDREIRMARAFDAPRELLFGAWTTPGLVRRWLLGPPGWTMPNCQIDLDVGGRYRFVVRNMSTGAEMGWGGVYREIIAPERIVTAELFDQDWTGGETQVTILLAAEGGGRTRLTQSILFSSPEARNAALRTDIERGAATSYDRLEGLLASRTLQGERRSAA